MPALKQGSTQSVTLLTTTAGNVSLKDSLKMLVVDEADLVLSFGGADDIRAIVPHLPKICQSFLMSATLSSELEELKRLVLHSPAILRLEGDDASGRLTQFFVHVPAEDRYLVLYVPSECGGCAHLQLTLQLHRRQVCSASVRVNFRQGVVLCE